MADKLTLKPGVTSMVDLAFLSVPPAKVTWYYNGQDKLPDDARIKPLTSQTSAKLTMMKVAPTDAGEYKVVIENKNGKIEHTVNVAVQSPPSEPKNVLVDNITKSSCLVTWEAPESDNGSPVIGYDIEKQVGKTGKWIKINKEPITTTQYEVNDLTPGSECSFRVSASNAAGPSVYSKPSGSFVAKDAEAPKPSAPINLQTSDINGEITLSWQPPENDGGSPIKHYIIEKADVVK
ncbi:hypothetical protein HELRODRAFT_78197, partial [Helobdella robusta]|uniref:Fibronectin type-III domain-containing protein n=1 Tax=Helobdella robusta TaxID=6412 RepID=T1G393_HELRO